MELCIDMVFGLNVDFESEGRIKSNIEKISELDYHERRAIELAEMVLNLSPNNFSERYIKKNS